MNNRLFLSLTMSLALLISGAAVLGAQSNQLIDRLLEQKQATVGDAAALILAAAGMVPEEATADAAVAAAVERKLLNAARMPDSPITLGEISYLIMAGLGMRGGLMYMILPGPRYAARELAYLRIVKGNTHPSRAVGGEEVIRMLGAALERISQQGGG